LIVEKFRFQFQTIAAPPDNPGNGAPDSLLAAEIWAKFGARQVGCQQYILIG